MLHYKTLITAEHKTMTSQINMTQSMFFFNCENPEWNMYRISAHIKCKVINSYLNNTAIISVCACVCVCVCVCGNTWVQHK